MKKEVIVYQCTYENTLFRNRSEVLTVIKDYILADLPLDYNITRHKVRRMLVESRRRGFPTYQVKVWGCLE